eukprot:7796-Heterococcus_DN1.PRE.3
MSASSQAQQVSSKISAFKWPSQQASQLNVDNASTFTTLSLCTSVLMCHHTLLRRVSCSKQVNRMPNTNSNASELPTPTTRKQTIAKNIHYETPQHRQVI